jgi:threonyl-tRNA synthetase
MILPIADRHWEHAEKVAAALKGMGMRVKVDTRSETINYRIREAQVEQVPYMLVVGDKELAADGAALRHRREGDLGILNLSDMMVKFKEEIDSKA